MSGFTLQLTPSLYSKVVVSIEEQVLVCVNRFPVDFNVEPSVLLKVCGRKGSLVSFTSPLWNLCCHLVSEGVPWRLLRLGFNLDSGLEPMVRCCSFEGAQCPTFHFLNVEVGHNRRHRGAHDTAMPLSFSVLFCRNICCTWSRWWIGPTDYRFVQGWCWFLRFQVLSCISRFWTNSSASNVGMHV